MRVKSLFLQRHWVWAFFVCLLPCFVFAQTTPHCQKVKVQPEPFFLDSLSVLPASLQIPALPTLKIRYDLNTGKAQFEGNLPTQDSVTVCYERLPISLTKWSEKRNVALIDTTDKYWREVIQRTEGYVPPREQLIELKDFQKSGNFVRGLSLGNAQNVFVNSALNLQLEGKITDDLTLTAILSDQQIPYQPEGNTQQLQDLDRILIRFAHKNGSLTAGDIVLQNRDNHFLKFYKNTQGGLLETRYKVGKDTAQTYAGIAVARGKFYSATLPPLEGVQGPYRLMGPNGELFIIVLANSEKVFIDGKLMQRGYDYDYVIDYNLGEVTFNSHILITRFTRIRIDFEYAEQNYTRSILTAGHEHRSKRWQLLTQFYREGDNPNNGLIKLSDSAKAQLRGQTAGVGVVSGIDSAGYQPNSVLYQLQDTTTANGTYRNIVVYRTNNEQAFYRVTFLQVGKNQGDYVRTTTNVNGQVYKWVEPLNGIKQGDYEPLKTVPLPNRRQVWATKLAYQMPNNASISAEMALSSQQNNLFSDLPTAKMTGIATRLAYQYNGKMVQDSATYTWFGGASYEYNQDKFTPIDRFRSIEFDRDWSKNIDSSRLADHILQTEIGLRNKKNSLIAYKLNLRNRENQVNGWQQMGRLEHQFKRLTVSGNAFFLRSAQDSLQSSWQRWQASMAYKTRYFVPSYVWEGDKNNVFLPQKDSVVRTAMHYEGHTFAIRNADSTRLKFLVSYNIRQDNAPLEGKMLAYLSSETLTLQTNYTSQKQRTVALTAVYRKASINEKFASQAQSGENLQGRLDWIGEWKLKKKQKKDSLEKKNTPLSPTLPLATFKSELSLTTATGQELQREYFFLLVPVGQGTHAWRDDNNNGTQELNEFYVAVNPDERKFAKIFRPTNTYIPAYTQALTYRLNWAMPAQKKGKNTNLPLSGLLSWNVTRRFVENNVLARLLPVVAVQDTNLLTEQRSFRKAFFFFRNNLEYSGELTYQNVAQKQLLLNGFEAKRRQDVKASWRNQLSTKWNLQTQGLLQDLQNESDFLENRNYKAQIYQASPELSYQIDNNKRLVMGYQFAHKVGKEIGDSLLTAQVHQVSLEARYSKASRRNITANARFLQIRYKGEQNTPLAYEMLEALRVGTNFTWQMNWTERLQNGLQLTFSYEGRKSEGSPLIHLGRAQVGLLF
ncbi:MAG: hypothetical protein EAZ95_19235 [Bacteroidetes bacterium]|nr:MAG: hypothetical protein EAZ95_19235 [Bacteroidota bacterium]